MKERVFFDTNVLVYLFAADNPAKQGRVQDLLSNRELRTQLIQAPRSCKNSMCP